MTTDSSAPTDIRALAEEALEDDKTASPGPWAHCGASDGQCSCSVVWSKPIDYPVMRGTNEDDGSGRWQDARFVAAARTREPELARAVLRLLDDNLVLIALRDAVAETLAAWEAAEDRGNVWDTQDWKAHMDRIADRIAKEGK